jgi:alginate O-acetyltransferase complex protein AlgI
MLFQNLSFFVLCAVTFALYWRVPKARLWVLAAANAVFYVAAGWENLCLFLGASALTYALGQHVTGPRGKLVMWAGIVLNVANLAFFKYAGFAATNLHALWPVPLLDPRVVSGLLLPIGISFYTFQHISYLVDRRVKALPSAPNYLHFWVYISFFGHSVAGPIMRGAEFFPQIADTIHKRLDGAELRYGLYLFGLGLFKKIAIADHLAPHVDAFFANPGGLSFGEAWAAAFLFAFRIYYDFSAYSDMAVGIGHMFGYKLAVNFRTPYVAANASEFWSRWHVTLSSWIRDYVYIPLGGNRVGVVHQQANLMLAMLASGLWHGAAWTFVLWGAFHGALQVGQRVLKGVKARLGWAVFGGRAYRAVAIVGFFVLTTYGWVLFRATSLPDALTMMRTMLDVTNVGSVLAVKGVYLTILGLYGLHWAEWAVREREAELGAWWQARVPAIAQGAAYAAVVLWLMVVHSGGQDFIYFKF